MNRIARILTTALLLIPLGGCWSKKELNDRSFITSAYVDMGEKPGEVMLTVAAPLPNRLGSATNPNASQSTRAFTADTQSAASLPEAMEKIQKDLTRKLNWGQTRAIVISADYARQRGFKNILEWAFRNPTLPLRTYVFISEGQAKEVVGMTPVFEGAPSEVLREFGNRHFVGRATVKDLAVATAAGVGIAVPLLETGRKPLVSEGGKNSLWTGIAGSAMIQNMHMKDKLGVDETRVVSWTHGDLSEPIYDVLYEGGQFNFKLYRLKGSIRTGRPRGDEIPCTVEIRAEATLESLQTRLDVSEAKQLHRLEQKINAALASDLRLALEKSQAAGADILEVGRHIEWRYPKSWDRMKTRWPQIYGKEVHFKVTADIRITHLNAENKPFWDIVEGEGQ